MEPTAETGPEKVEETRRQTGGKQSAATGKPARKPVIPIADPSKGETQEDVDAAWVESLLAKQKPDKPKRGDNEISDKWRELLEISLSGDLTREGTRG